MTLTDTRAHYGPVTRTLHWLTALMIFVAFPLGLWGHTLTEALAEAEGARQASLAAQAATVYSLHKTLGVTVFLVSLARILWALAQPRPGLLNGDRRAEAMAAHTVHWLLYSAMLLAPLTGWIHHAATTGFAPIWWPFGQTLPFVPQDPTVAAVFTGLHWAAVWTLAAAVVLHVAGALKHHVIDRDATLLRMLRGTPASGTQDRAGHVRPFAAAMVILTAMLSYGSFTVRPEAAPQAGNAALETVESGWTVTEGRLGLSVTQMGNTVDGSFADWTAEIEWAEGDASGPAGHVRVVISIPSMTLGSVTSQALDADFLAADTYERAVFDADLIRTEDGQRAEGTLTLRGTEMPLSFPFALTIEGDKAEASGSFALDRRDFGIGDHMPTEETVGFTVDVSFDLIAERAD